MDQSTQIPTTLLDHVQAFARTQAELYSLQVTDRTASIISRIVSRIIIALFLVIIVLLLSIGLALWLGIVMGQMYLGFLLVAGLYAIITLFLYGFRSAWIHHPVRRSVISMILK